MSMHKKPLTRIEEEGLRAHGLEVGSPSQLSDAFRQGVAWALSSATPEQEPVFQITHGQLGSDGLPEWFDFVSLTEAGIENFSNGTKLYTHADPSEVAHERWLREKAEYLCKAVQDQRDVYDLKLGEAMSIIERVKIKDLVSPNCPLGKRIDALLFSCYSARSKL